VDDNSGDYEVVAVQDKSMLFSPFKIGGLTLANRITMAPLFLGYADAGGRVSTLYISHYRTMAESGAALVVVENAAVEAAGMGSPFMFRVDDDSCMVGLTAVAKTIHESGTLAFQQINHAGRYTYGKERIAPSPVPSGDVIPKEMTVRDIGRVVRAFADAARRVKAAGFDGVELHGGTGYLLAQFVSPRTNRRTDEYGGSLENRMRFPLEVIDAVKAAVGDAYPVGYRFLADELLPGGLAMNETEIFARVLAKKDVAYLSVMAGTHESFGVSPYVDMEKEEGYMVPFAERIKIAIPRTPVIAAGRIQTPEFAERVLSEGKADLIGLARVLFADPLWPKKARGLNSDPIIRCGETCSLCTRTVVLGKPAYCSRRSGSERSRFSGAPGGAEQE
jgi:2,4-dienoyl-CoA reductase-like NADH-dependent reductase (Old Yellow Enzyme family)